MNRTRQITTTVTLAIWQLLTAQARRTGSTLSGLTAVVLSEFAIANAESIGPEDPADRTPLPNRNPVDHPWKTPLEG